MIRIRKCRRNRRPKWIWAALMPRQPGLRPPRMLLLMLHQMAQMRLVQAQVHPLPDLQESTLRALIQAATHQAARQAPQQQEKEMAADQEVVRVVGRAGGQVEMAQVAEAGAVEKHHKIGNDTIKGGTLFLTQYKSQCNNV